MKQLLEKWAALDPQRISTDALSFHLKGYLKTINWSELQGLDGDHDKYRSQWSIQGAVQQAIEARGWKWGRDLETGIYVVARFILNSGVKYWRFHEHHITLLAAYIAALEAKTEEVAECAECTAYDEDQSNNVPCREHQK